MAAPKRLTPAQMRAACERFNSRYSVGDEIIVYTGVIGENPRRATVRHPAEIMGGHTPVVYVTGEGRAHGAIALTHTASAEAL